MLTARRPRNMPDFTGLGTRADGVGLPPRPTFSTGWKWVPRWRTMISPALTTWPPYRLTPSRCAFESRPLRLDDAPFLCAISSLRLLDPGNSDLRVLLPVTLTALVARLVPVVDHVDLRPGGRPDNLDRDLVPAQLGRVADHRLAINHKQRGERNGRSLFLRQLVDGEHVIEGDLLLPTATAHNRVHPRTLFSLVRALCPRSDIDRSEAFLSLCLRSSRVRRARHPP